MCYFEDITTVGVHGTSLGPSTIQLGGLTLFTEIARNGLPIHTSLYILVGSKHQKSMYCKSVLLCIDVQCHWNSDARSWHHYYVSSKVCAVDVTKYTSSSTMFTRDRSHNVYRHPFRTPADPNIKNRSPWNWDLISLKQHVRASGQLMI